MSSLFSAVGFRGVLRMRKLALCALVLCAASFWPLAVRAEGTDTRRFALVVGANDGGQQRALLRYAQRDARAVANVLEQLGGVSQSDQLVLFEPKPSELKRALKDLEARALAARGQGQRTQLLFYYSGHSDERGLLLGEERVPYRELRDGLMNVGAAVHIGVLDSCSSGVLTRLKGGQKLAPFLMDSSNEVQGHAFLTSSSADEGAQESDRMGASFFTHYFVSGLRGAADFSADGVVTLNEAYRYAFDETLARTADTSAGPQHAAYDIQLVGTGDLVMTDLRQPAAALSIPKAMAGRLYVRDGQGNLVVELNKPPGRIVELALDAQTYQILLDQDGSLSRTRVLLAANTTTVLQPGAFERVHGETNRLRGDEIVPEGELVTVPVGIGLFPPLSTNWQNRNRTGGKAVRIRNGFGLHLGWGYAHQLDGFAIALGGNQFRESVDGVQVAVGVNLTEKLDGVQIGVGANVARDVDGAQIGAALNLSMGHMLGVQVGLVNVADQVDGVQVSIANIGRGIDGVQVGLLNLSGSVSGLQLGLANLATVGDVDGVQIGLLDFATGKMDGLQVGVANYASSADAQIGLLNIASGGPSSAQIGLVNYADSADAQVGLLGITREGGVHPVFFMGNPIAMQAGVRFDAKYTYGTILGGIQPEQGKNTYSAGLAVGGKIPLPLPYTLFVEPELSQQVLFLSDVELDDPSTMARFALNGRYQYHRHLSFFGGPAFSLLIHSKYAARDRDPSLFSNAFEIGSNGKTQFLGSFGFQLGASF